MRGRVTHTFQLATRPSDYDLFQRVGRLDNLIAITSDPTPIAKPSDSPAESKAAAEKAASTNVDEHEIFDVDMDA